MTSPRPLLVVVGGAPGAGKTSLATILARELGVPLVAKDAVKETLGSVLPAPDVAASREIGAASYALLYAIAGWLLDAGIGLILESNFQSGRSETALAPLAARSRAVLVHCDVPEAIAQARYAARVRHAVHRDAERVWGASTAGGTPLALGIPTLVVDTTNGYRPPLDAIVAFARSA